MTAGCDVLPSLAGLQWASAEKEKGYVVKLVNLTGHDVKIIQWNNDYRVIGSNGLLRVYSNQEVVGEVSYDGVQVPLLEISGQTVERAPIEDDTLYVVSGIAAAKAHRSDFIVPSRVVREGGTVIGCRAFSRMKLGE